jgi:hypothetical protein
MSRLFRTGLLITGLFSIAAGGCAGNQSMRESARESVAWPVASRAALANAGDEVVADAKRHRRSCVSAVTGWCYGFLGRAAAPEAVRNCLAGGIPTCEQQYREALADPHGELVATRADR